MKHTVKRNNQPALKKLYNDIVDCDRCRRLVQWRTQVANEKVPRFQGWDYWGKPVPGFGDPAARLLVVGLAPAAHGGNRTGRVFTGDRSGDWLYRALHKFGFANQPASTSRNDGLKCIDCYITASARCAPPKNKLLPVELVRCRPFFLRELFMLRNVCVVVALGKVAFDCVHDAFCEIELTAVTKRQKFNHGAEYPLNEHQTLIASFHPSQQNTFTGKLTEKMFDAVFRRARTIIGSKL